MPPLRDDPRPAEARARDIAEVADALGLMLRPASGELVGPCPVCGGTDRFSVSPQKQVFCCRKCPAGGDVIALVMHAQGLTFPAALDWLCGPRQQIDPAVLAERQRKADASARARADREARERARAIAEAQEIWRNALPAEGSPVRDYLTLRGILRAHLPALPVCLRYAPSLPYMVRAQAGGSGWTELYRGPAMIAAIRAPDGRLTAVHRTWIDLTRPKGKADLGLDSATGKRREVKKVWGSKKGGAIRLSSPAGATTLVMGEGIETTLSAMIGRRGGAPWAWWAGIDLGNMGGRAQRGPGLRRAGLPDLDDDRAFVPPPQITRLIYVMDGDSDPEVTRHILLAGLRRARMLRPGLQAGIVRARPGCDLNDMLLGAGAPEEGT